MQLNNVTSTTICPYCAQPVSPYSGRTDCPHCARPLFGVSCPSCGRKTLNLTLLARHGRATCFNCQAVVEHLPEDEPRTAHPALAESPVAAPVETKRPALMQRAPKSPVMPTPQEARAVVEKCLVGLERAGQDREMLRAPDLRAILMQYLDTLQDLLELDNAMERGELTDAALRNPKALEVVADVCYAPLWPHEGVLLPPSVEAWVLVVDDAARRWQYARRRWLAEECKLTYMPTVPTVTTVNPAWHDITGKGQVITEVITPGFLLHGEVLRKAVVRA